MKNIHYKVSPGLEKIRYVIKQTSAIKMMSDEIYVSIFFELRFDISSNILYSKILISFIDDSSETYKSI